jgi:hypothetical protein
VDSTECSSKGEFPRPLIRALRVHFSLGACGEWHTLLKVVHPLEVASGGNTCAKFVPSRVIPPRSRFTAALMVMALIMGTFVTGSASASQSSQLTTCLNLATGANRVLVRGACDSVLEMTQVWDQVSADEPVGKFFFGTDVGVSGVVKYWR